MPTTTNTTPSAYVARWRRTRLVGGIIACQLNTQSYNVAVPLIIVGLACAFGALAIYERYAGENPIADTIYDGRLRCRNLAALDRAARKNPRRSDVIVTLTPL